MNNIVNVDVVAAAVGESTRHASFELGVDSFQGRVAVETGTKIVESARKTIDVAMVSLDEFLGRGRSPIPSVFKIDVEGGETGVLVGATETLRSHRPIVFLSTHGADLHRESCSILGDLGYRLESLDGHPLDICATLLAIPSVVTS